MSKELLVKILNNSSYRDMNASRIGTIVPAVIDGGNISILGKYLGIKMDQDRYYYFSILRNEVEIVEETAANDEVLVGDHYTLADGTNTMDTIKAIVGNKAGLEAFFVGNIVKYIARYEKKNGVDDVRKAKDYCERLIKLLEEREDEDEQE